MGGLWWGWGRRVGGGLRITTAVMFVPRYNGCHLLAAAAVQRTPRQLLLFPPVHLRQPQRGSLVLGVSLHAPTPGGAVGSHRSGHEKGALTFGSCACLVVPHGRLGAGTSSVPRRASASGNGTTTASAGRGGAGGGGCLPPFRRACQFQEGFPVAPDPSAAGASSSSSRAVQVTCPLVASLSACCSASALSARTCEPAAAHAAASRVEDASATNSRQQGGPRPAPPRHALCESEMSAAFVQPLWESAHRSRMFTCTVRSTHPRVLP